LPICEGGKVSQTGKIENHDDTNEFTANRRSVIKVPIKAHNTETISLARTESQAAINNDVVIDR